MPTDSQKYVSRAAIQKGIYWTDLNLVNTSLAHIWGSIKHESWLKWKIDAIVNEAAWYLAGELNKFLMSEPGDNLIEWKKFFYKLSLCIKNKDAEGLFLLIENGYDIEECASHPEITLMRYWRDLINKNGDPATIVDCLYNTIVKSRIDDGNALSDYECVALNIIRNKILCGGKFKDRMVGIASMILIYTRGLDEEKILKSISDAIKESKSNIKNRPSTVEFGLRVYDTTTAIGKYAALSFIERNDQDYPWLSYPFLVRIWNIMDSLSIPKNKRFFKNTIIQNPTFLDSVWWPCYSRKALTIVTLRPKDVYKIWSASIWPSIEKIVAWIVKGDE